MSPLGDYYATDTIFANVKSYKVYNASQVFGGTKSGKKKVYGLRSESQPHQALENFIREVGVSDLGFMFGGQVWDLGFEFGRGFRFGVWVYVSGLGF